MIEALLEIAAAINELTRSQWETYEVLDGVATTLELWSRGMT